ncbi:MAG: UbiA-like polyprenyltransferase [Thermodesulfobacteriota bacterium]|nr:UbiA-like polyprenyltransferase [Thermodesulfobacteriota bacterium]
MKKKEVTAGDYLFSLTVCLFIWKFVAMGISSPVLPCPETVLRALTGAMQGATFWNNFFISAWRVVASIILAWSLAFPLGMIIGFNRRLNRIFAPVIFMTYPVPKIVLLPIILLFFGIGDLSKIILITMILFFQILLAVRDGVKAIDTKYIDSLKSLGASDLDIIKEIVIPSALPHSFTALRISTGTAISVLFFVESFATTSGLGYMIMDAWAKAMYVDIFVYIIAMAMLGIILYEIIDLLEKKICAWNLQTDSPLTTPSGLTTYLKMIKFSHTIFALPFALASVVLAYKYTTIDPADIFWIITAMIGARSAAMGFNRLADAAIDKKNPRTAAREIPSGTMTGRDAVIFILVSAIIFVFSAGMLSMLCLWLCLPVLFMLFFYSFTKRFTWLCHLILGLAIGMVPMAVWVALTGEMPWRIGVLGLALLTYIAGFDILYACQDVGFDRDQGLYSIPARFGIKPALVISAALHLATLSCLVGLFWIFDLNAIYLGLTGIIGLLLIVEHWLVTPDDLSRIPIAFFHVNSIISVLILVSILAGSLAG